MGNNQSLSLDEKKSYIQQNLRFVKQTENDAYGEVKIMKNELNQDIFAVKQYSFQDRDKLDNFIKRSERRKQLVSPSIVELVDVEADKAEDFCSQFFKLSLVYQYHPETLQQLIDKRKKLRKRFSEQEIFLLIDCICSALLVIDSFDMKHEDIRPQTIVISQDNKYKVTDIKFLTQFSQYKRLLIGVSDTNYLSPILFQQMEHRIASPQHNEMQSDIFSLGLVCLEMASLRSIQGIYDWEKYVISEEKVEALIFQAKEDGYSETLIELILRMLQIEENDRVNAAEVLNLLEPIREQYINIKLSFTTSRFGDRSQIADHSQSPLSYISHSQFNSPEAQSVIIKNQSQFLSRKPSLLNYSNSQKENFDAIVLAEKPIVQHEEEKRSSPPNQKDKTVQVKQGKRNLELDDICLQDNSEVGEKQIQQYQQNQEEQNYRMSNLNSNNEDAQEYWEKSLQYLDQDVENVLNETNRLQQQFNMMPKMNLDESAIDNLITKRLEQKNDSLIGNLYSHKHSHSMANQVLPHQNNQYSNHNLHNTSLSQNTSKSRINNERDGQQKHYLHSDTRSIANPSQNNLQYQKSSTRQSSPRTNSGINSKRATPLKQDFIDKQQGNNNLYDVYLNEYKKLVNNQAQSNSNVQQNQNHRVQQTGQRSQSTYMSKY